MKNKATSIVLLLVVVIGVLYYFFIFRKKGKIIKSAANQNHSNGNIAASKPIKDQAKPVLNNGTKPIFQTYTVQAGDTLSKVAIKTKVSFPNLVAANPQIKNVNMIYVGQKINIPTIKIRL